MSYHSPRTLYAHCSSNILSLFTYMPLLSRVMSPKLFTWKHPTYALRLIAGSFPEPSWQPAKKWWFPLLGAVAVLLHWKSTNHVVSAVSAGLHTLGRVTHLESTLKGLTANICWIALGMEGGKRELQIMYSKMHNGKVGMTREKGIKIILRSILPDWEKIQK